MSDPSTLLATLPPQQQAIRAKCLHPTGAPEEFKEDEIEQTIPERFERIVRMYPQRLAVKMGDRSLTYDELNKTANRIARAIIEKRAPGSEPIALLFEHGIDAIAAIIAVLKAGKFYVALDPSFPPERNTYMLEDSGARLIVTNSQNMALARTLTNDTRALLVITDINNDSHSENLTVAISLNDLMNLLYTSGSTGKPKGVARDHRNSARSANEIPISVDDRLSLLHSLSFGSSESQLYSALLNGASLFPFDVKSQGVQRLANWLLEEQITICHLPPAVFRQLADMLSGRGALPSLRMIRLSGAPITRQDFDLYKQNFSPATLLRIGMGSTEAGRICSAVLDQTFCFPNEGTAAGYPAPDKKILLLDDNGDEVGPNQIGEITVKGRGLALGYWHKPELTSTKFVSDPKREGEPIYLTGDLGRILPNGFLIHLGRKDLMVKIRGYRVELGDIERALSTHPSVLEVGVIAWEQELGEKCLVAYVVPRTDPSPKVDELRRFLKNRLPDYMIPSDFMFLTSLPLTNGKLDRTALPKPERSRPDLTKPYVPPRTEIEKKLVQIWENVLNVQPVGIQDNFFDLGGHSLIASRLFLEIEKAYGKTFPLTTLYWARTIEKLARVLEQDNWAAPWSLLFPIQLKGSKPPFFWVYGETSDALLPRYLGPEQPVYGLMHECRTGKQVRHTQLVDIAANHLQEIRLVQPRGPYYLGGFCFGGMVAFEIAQQLRQQGEEVALLFLLDLATIKNCSFLLGQNPGSETMSAKLKSLRDEVCRHFHYLAALPPREQFTYVRVRAMDRARKMFRYSKIVSKKIVRNFYFAVHHDLPLSFHEQYISEVDRHAVANYKPQPYWGRVLFFKANGGSYDDQLVAKLVGDGLEAHEVQCGHSEIIKEPYIRVWAEKLKSCLSEAQAKVP